MREHSALVPAPLRRDEGPPRRRGAAQVGSHYVEGCRALINESNQRTGRVGGSKPQRVDVRIIAATNRNLEELVAAGGFRQDLQYRVSAFTVVLPPLRARERDVIEIARGVLERAAPGKRLSRAAERLLLQYCWPGNIRELENVVRSAAVVTVGNVITDGVLRRRTPFAGFVLASPGAGMPRQERALQLLRRDGQLTSRLLQKELGLPRTQAWRVLEELERQGSVVLRGRGRASYYVEP